MYFYTLKRDLMNILSTRKGSWLEEDFQRWLAQRLRMTPTPTRDAVGDREAARPFQSAQPQSVADLGGK